MNINAFRGLDGAGLVAAIIGFIILALIFSFGFFGFIAYYWYPVKQVVDTIKSKNKDNKMLALSLSWPLYST